MSEDRDDGPRRTAAEWTALAVSALILLVLVGLITTDLFAEERPAHPVATVVGPLRRVGDVHVVTVEVQNRGDGTATEVQVRAELTSGDRLIVADQVLEQLSGHETQEVEVVLPADPGDGGLSVRVTSFQHP